MSQIICDKSQAKMRLKFLVLAVTLVACPLCICQQSEGTVCVASRTDDAFWKQPPLSNGQVVTRGLRLKVDKRPTTEWPAVKSLKVEGLETNKRHLLAVLDSHGKPIESVRFRFSEYKSSNLCMAYDGYQGIQLQKATRHTPWCKCK